MPPFALLRLIVANSATCVLLPPPSYDTIPDQMIWPTKEMAANHYAGETARVYAGGMGRVRGRAVPIAVKDKHQDSLEQLRT